jgi:hypothetical protein
VGLSFANFCIKRKKLGSNKWKRRDEKLGMNLLTLGRMSMRMLADLRESVEICLRSAFFFPQSLSERDISLLFGLDECVNHVLHPLLRCRHSVKDTDRRHNSYFVSACSAFLHFN